MNEDDDYVIEGTMPHMTVEGEVKMWLPDNNGGHIGIIISDDGGTYTVHSDNFARPSDLPNVTKGTRVRFRYVLFRDDDGNPIMGKDVVTGQRYSTGSARHIEVIPFEIRGEIFRQ